MTVAAVPNSTWVIRVMAPAIAIASAVRPAIVRRLAVTTSHSLSRLRNSIRWWIDGAISSIEASAVQISTPK